jgi:hypothetical protein
MNNTKWLLDRGLVVSGFGSQVAEIIGTVYKGIYHIDQTAQHKRTEWHSDSWIEITISNSLATYDGNQLTQLVVLCHDAAIRLEIRASCRGYLKLCFSPRDATSKSTFYRHPSLEQAIQYIRTVA